MNRILTLFFALSLSLLLHSCGEKSNPPAELKLGVWRGVITQQGQQLPFNFTLQRSDGDASKLQMVIHNDEERILIDEVTRKGDSLLVTFNFFDTEIRATIDDNKLTGLYNKRYSENHILKFEAEYGNEQRFIKSVKESSAEVTGKYSVVFTEDDGKQYPAVAKLRQTGDKVTGTFLTETGDYRYLEGITDGDSLKLSAFDGTHLFLFTALISGDSLTGGEFWHAKNTYETWKGYKNSEAQLTDQYKLTYLKEGYNKLSFTFPDLEGNPVSLEDQRFKNKVVILQIFGTWCPNCMDETQFYTEWYNNNRDKDVEIIGLAYENKPDFEYAKNRVQKMKDKLNVPYDFLVAGTSNKQEASKTLPMLNAIISFPTSIFLDKNGDVYKIHTGFSGPGTGEDYEKWKASFESLMDEMLSD
ncbi:MAG: TlpA disulfide reductase family protein [Bacteroidota bacterium]